MKPHELVILEIARERERQMAVEGWTPEHDDTHDKGEMAMASAAYAADAGQRASDDISRWGGALWPAAWSLAWWKPRDPRRNLIIAAALIVAEIERLDRAAASSGRS